MMSPARISQWARPADVAAGLIAGLMVFAVCGSAPAAVEPVQATAGSEAGTLRMEKHGDAVTLEAHDVSLHDVLAEIARQTDLHLILQHPLETRISVAFEPQPLADVLRQLLRHQSYLLHLSRAEDAMHIANHERFGTLWVFAAEHADTPDQQVIEPGVLSHEVADFAMLRAQLTSGDFRRKKDAIKILRKLGDQGAIELLSLALADEDRRIRVESIQALANIGGDAAIAALAGVSGDGNASIRAEATFALGMIGDESAVQQLRHTLHDPDSDVREAAIEAFTDIGGQQSIAALSDLLRHEDPTTRADAIDALGEIGGPAVRPYLQQALNDDDELVRESAAEFLTAAAGTEPLR